jgi:hypothetical protein
MTFIRQSGRVILLRVVDRNEAAPPSATQQGWAVLPIDTLVPLLELNPMCRQR